MAASRYWRIVGLETHGRSDLELSELHLHDVVGRVDQAAVIAASHAPVSGVLNALQDTDTFSVCRFDGSSARSPGFFIEWDFGVGNNVAVMLVRPGASASVLTFLESCLLQCSGDRIKWETIAPQGRFIFPGPNAMFNLDSGGDMFWPQVAALIPFDEALGATAFADRSANNLSIARASAAPVIAADAGFPSGRALSLNGSAQAWITFPNVTGVRLGSGDWTCEVTLRPNVASGFRGVCGDWLINGQGNWRFYTADAAIGFVIGSGEGVQTTFVPGQVIRLAVVKRSNLYTLFKNGVPVNAFTSAWTPTQYNNPIVIGTNESYNPVNFIGMVGEFRITQGVARYDDAYTPPAVSLPAFGIFGAARIDACSALRARVAASRAASPHRFAAPDRVAMVRDIDFGGAGRIWGTTKTKATPSNLPAKARVVLLHQRSKLPVRETWSDAVTGAFAFEGIDTRQEFLTLAEDAAGAYRPVAANRLVPEVPA